MSKKKFETVEEAEKYLQEIQNAHKDEFKVFKEESEAVLGDLKEKIKQMTANTETIQKERDDAFSDRDEALGEVESLSEQLELKSKNTSGGEIVAVGKKSYAIKGKRFNVPGVGVLTAEELAKNQDALDYLIKVKSGVLVEVKGSK